MTAGPDEVVVVASEVPVTVREATVTAGAVTVVTEVVVVREVPEPPTVITFIAPVNVAVVQSGPMAVVSSGGDATYTFFQLAPAVVWTIPHPLAKHPAVTVQDSAGRQVLGEVQYLSDDLVVISFRSPFSGRADLN